MSRFGYRVIKAKWTGQHQIAFLVGIRIQGMSLHIDPCIPHDWPGFTATITWRSARYTVVVENPNRVARGVRSIKLDGIPLPGGAVVDLVDDGGRHTIDVTLGKASTEQAA